MVAGGSLCCYGSPIFLRQHLGCGYYLTLAKSSQSFVTRDSKVRPQAAPDPCPHSHPAEGGHFLPLKGDSEDPRWERKPDSRGNMAGEAGPRDP